jgi:hypothetical protein
LIVCTQRETSLKGNVDERDQPVRGSSCARIVSLYFSGSAQDSGSRSVSQASAKSLGFGSNIRGACGRDSVHVPVARHVRMDRGIGFLESILIRLDAAACCIVLLFGIGRYILKVMKGDS